MERARLALATLPQSGDVLLVIPPFTSVALPLLAPHHLQAIGRDAGFGVSVLHGNLVFADMIGVPLYETICKTTNRTLLGERLFAEPAYDLPPLGHGLDLLETEFPKLARRYDAELEWCTYRSVTEPALAWSEEVARAIADLDYRVVGCSAMFEQVSASIALLRRVKHLRPDIVTLIGGANCEGPMARGIVTLSPDVDYVFSGESDATFPAFLRELTAGRRPAERIVVGASCRDLDALPVPSFLDYYRQVERLLPGGPANDPVRRTIRVPLESSRGCWWGQKHHCTFCGLNGLGMAFREKSAGRAADQLAQIALEYPHEALGSDRVKVSMTDNIMPRAYFRTLLPHLARQPTRADVFYEQKSNLTFDDVCSLKSAGIELIQPGIESLSTSYLKRMRKGVTAAQNLALLRYATSAGLSVTWNLLTHFPQDTLEELEQILALLPLLHHLPPPDGPCALSVDRFSPYFDEPEAHGVRDVRPLAAYGEVFPAGVPLYDLAYFFDGDYESASMAHPEIIDRIRDELRAWRAIWRRRDVARPMLSVRHPSQVWNQVTGAGLVLVDTRKLPGSVAFRSLTEDEARVLLVRSLPDDPGVQSAIERQLLVVLDGWTVPLATAEPEILRRFERARQDAAAREATSNAATSPAVSQMPPRISL